MNRVLPSSPLSLQEIHWQPVPALPYFCSISSSEPQAIDRAKPVFAPWLVSNSFVCNSYKTGENNAKRLHHWHIERGCWWQAREQGRIREEAPTLQHEDLGHLIAQIEYAALQKLISHLEADFFGLHSALLCRDGRAIVIVGPKEAGKSTLSCALWQAGWHLRCDDFSLLDSAHRVHATARRVSLRNSSRALVGEALWNRMAQAPATLKTRAGCLFHPHEMRNGVKKADSPAEIAAIFFLRRRDAAPAPAEAQPILGAQAALSLLPYSTFLLAAGGIELSVETPNWGDGLLRLTRLAAQVPAFDLGRGDLNAMTQTIERIVFST